MTQEHNYTEYKDGPGDNLLAQISYTASLQSQKEAEVAKLEEDLQRAKEELRNISEVQLPQLMDAADMAAFTTKEGIKIECLEKIRASIPAARAPEAFKWLLDHGHENIIKQQFVIEFGRNQEEWAEEFQKSLSKDLNVKRSKAVHAATLAAFVKEQLEEGVNIPLDVFGAFRQRFAKIKVS